MNNFETVYIVGNGLDICCGIKSSYSNFMDSLESKILDYPELIRFLYSSHRNKLWTDLETELGDIAINPMGIGGSKLFSLVYNHQRFEEEFEKLKYLLYEYLRDINKHAYHKTMPLELMNSYVNSEGGLYILNFNYTEVVDNYLYASFVSQKINCKINHIHGTLNDNINIILGVQDSRKLKKEHSFLYKTRYADPQKVFEAEQALRKAKRIIVFGTSLGESDYSYFENFFQEQCQKDANPKEFIFYYYQKNGQNDLIYNLRCLTGNQLIQFYSNNNVQFYDSALEVG